MSSELATVIYGLGILVLFFLNRNQDSRTRKALWLPVIWLLIIGSRPVSEWLNIAPTTNSPDQYLDGSPLDRAVFAALLAIGLVVLFARGRRVIALLGSNWPILLFFAYCALSTTWSDYPDVAFKRWVKAMGDVVMVLIVVTDADPGAAIRKLLSRVGLVLLPVSVLLIKYFPVMGRAYTPEFGYWQQMYIGVTASKNSLGELALIFGLAATWELTELFQDKSALNRGRRLCVQGTIIAMVLWVFWTADSITSLSCFVLGAALLLVTASESFRSQTLIHIVILAMVSAATLVILVAPNLLSILGRDPTLTGRTQIWSTVLDVPVNRWTGTGFESFWLGDRMQRIWNLWWWHPNEAHNGYIEVLLNLGWVGISLLALLVIAGYKKILSGLRDTSLARLELAYLLVAIVYSFTEAGFRMLSLTWVFLLLAIVSAGIPVAEFQADPTSPYEMDGARASAALGSRTWSDPEPESF